MEPPADGRIRAAVHAVLKFEGYTAEEIVAFEVLPNHAPLCEFDRIGWDCLDEEGESRHPMVDRLWILAEQADVMLTAVAEYDRASG